MKKIEIFGCNRITPYSKVRAGCRGIVVEDGKILVSRERSGIVMIPGGGLEAGETLEDCCRREIEEETGYIVEPGECFLELDEYYGEYKFVGYYYVCRAVGKGERRPTEEEKAIGLAPVWLGVEEFVDTLSHYSEWLEPDEERSGMYLREYTAMREYLKLVGEGKSKNS